VAEIVTEVGDVTENVAIVNFVLLAPAETVTLAGTVATPVLLLESVTTAPLAGAAADKVTVPWEDVPPETVVGLKVSEESVTVAPELVVALT
jgi:hypothetical protein